jgi:hypothetical protein
LHGSRIPTQPNQHLMPIVGERCSFGTLWVLKLPISPLT